MNSLVINSLIKIKNDSLTNKSQTIVLSNVLMINILRLLYTEGFIQHFSIPSSNFPKKVILGFKENLSFQNLKIISSPSKEVHLKYKDICKLSSESSLLIFSTDKGLLSLRDCKRFKVGGVLLFSL